MEFSNLVFYSEDHKTLSALLGDLFETEVYPSEDSIFHQSKFFNFKVSPKENKKKIKKYDLESHSFEFTVGDKDELLDIKNKVQFFCYRHNIDIDQLIQTEGPFSLVIKDLDGRIWSFSVSR